MTRVLVAEDKESHRLMLLRALENAGHAVDTAKNGREALERLQRSRYALLITDLRMPEVDGLELLKRARAIDPQLGVLLMTAFGTVSDAVTAIREGAYDFLTKPVDPDHLVLVVQRMIDEQQRAREGKLRREREGEPAILGEDTAIVALLGQLERVAATDSTVLLLGESGTGKELFASRLHHLSPRRERLFLPINCAAIPEGLIESELFGHERGAFTGADSRRLGKFELAEGGTLMLDEIGELPLHLQVKLLRVLQERELMRVGGQETIPVDVRVIAASNRDLETMVREGRFRNDLYYRLSVFPLLIPPLRQRRGDIPILARHFLERLGRELGRPRITLSPAAVTRLGAYGWPGHRTRRDSLRRQRDPTGASDLPRRAAWPRPGLGGGVAPEQRQPQGNRRRGAAQDRSGQDPRGLEPGQRQQERGGSNPPGQLQNPAHQDQRPRRR
jgi:DNA-binding NtrC family response regulator